MENIESISLRLRYEAFSKYASAISKCSIIDDLGAVVIKHLKYLMPFNYGRILIFNKDYYHELLYGNNKFIVNEGKDFKLRGIEKIVVEKNIPQTKNNYLVNFDLVYETFKDFKISSDSYQEISIIPLNNLSIYTAFFGFLSKPTQIISQVDNQFAKLILDLYFTKFSEIRLSSYINIQKEIIEENFNVISEKNREIEQILITQENLIKKRTSQLEARNKILEEYSWITSHGIRSPLSNILGLTQLINQEFDNSLDIKETLGFLMKSAHNLDMEVKKANQLLSRHIN